MRFFDPSLEYRKYNQVARTPEQKTKKLAKLAERVRKHPELTINSLPTGDIIAAILDGYHKGEDLLDPEFFDMEDIVGFATSNGLMNDPQAQATILAAKSRQRTQKRPKTKDFNQISV